MANVKFRLPPLGGAAHPPDASALPAVNPTGYSPLAQASVPPSESPWARVAMLAIGATMLMMLVFSGIRSTKSWSVSVTITRSTGCVSSAAFPGRELATRSPTFRDAIGLLEPFASSTFVPARKLCGTEHDVGSSEELRTGHADTFYR